MDLSTAAAVVGASASVIAGFALRLAWNTAKEFLEIKKSVAVHRLEMSVGGREYVVNVSEIDKEDPAVIDQAITAVREVRTLAAA